MTRIQGVGRFPLYPGIISNWRFDGETVGTRIRPISPAAAPPAGTNPQFKLAGVFGYRPMAIKLAGVFVDKPLKVKVAGVFV